MHITVLAIGTRGEVQPLLALAVGLQQTGRHKVCLTAPDDFGALAREHGLDFFPLGMNARELLVYQSTACPRKEQAYELSPEIVDGHRPAALG